MAAGGPYLPPPIAGDQLRKGWILGDLCREVPRPLASPFFFFFSFPCFLVFLFGSDNNSAYQTTSGFSPWIAFLPFRKRGNYQELQKGKSEPRHFENNRIALPRMAFGEGRNDRIGGFES